MEPHKHNSITLVQMCDNTQKQATGKVAWGTFNTNTLLPKLLANEYCIGGGSFHEVGGLDIDDHLSTDSCLATTVATHYK